MSNRPYIVSLTGLRGIAALLVFLYHYSALHPGIRLDLAVPFIGSILQFPLGLGGVGVDVFFVLSGFLLTLPFARHALGGGDRPRVGRYFKRRFLRVFPAYYAQLILILAVGAWFVTWKPQTAVSHVAHLFMFFNIGWNPVAPLVGVWWTLPVEMGFYLLLPLLAPAMTPRRWVPTLLAGLVLSMAYRYWAAAHFGPVGPDRAFLAAVQLPGSLPEFLLGATAALWVQQMDLTGRRPPGTATRAVILLLGLLLPALWMWHVVVGAGADYWLGHWSMIVSPIALGLPLSAAVMSLYWGCRLGNLLLANRVVYFLGLISYSLYLWHFPVMQQIQQLAGERYADWPHAITFPLSTAAVILVATASYYGVERPFYRLRTWRQVFGKNSGPVA